MTTHRKTDYRLRRLDASRLELPNAWGIPVRVFANDGVPIERVAIDELLSLLELQDTIAAMQVAAPDLFDDADAGVEAVSLSSDFHKGRGIPIGTTLKTRGVAVPQAVGTDVNCGMRVMLTGLTLGQVEGNLDALARRIRHIFFQGGRGIGLTAIQREAMLREGIPGLLATDVLTGDAWLAAADELNRINGGGGTPTDVPAMFSDYIRGSGGSGGVTYDTQIGSLGGGNHFLELDVIQRIHDRATAHAWGIREGQIVVMTHTGSLGLGHTASAVGKQAMHALLPSGVPMPMNGITILPLGERCADALTQIRSAIQTAANFAFVNRFFLSRMAIRALKAEIGDASASLLWDAPHNLLWEQADGTVVHRKGSTPARGAEALTGTPFPWGEPVIVPGSMGTPSFILRGLGNAEALYSACHGAGRALSRGEAQRGHDAELDAFLARFRVVTPVDPRDLRGRADLVAAWRQELKQEAPAAYKDIGPVIDTLRDAQVAEPVAELHPIMTVKG
jgi:tRNA-splicing ligase RtcB